MSTLNPTIKPPLSSPTLTDSSIKKFQKPTTTMATGAHILVFPYPAQGHMIPLLDLAHQLSIHGLTITILVTPKNLPLLNPLLSINPSIKTLILPLPPHPSIPRGIENNKDLPPNCFRPMMRTLADLYDPLLHWFQTHSSPPVAILSDMFLGWTHKLASHLRIPRIVFSPSGAMALSIMYSLWSEMPEFQEIITFPDIPNSPKFPWSQISPLYRSSYLGGDPLSEFTKESFRENIASWGLVINSFSELERVYLDHLGRKMGVDRVWAVGPLHGLSRSIGSSSSSSSVDDLLSTWLDKREDETVVYVCFGSQAVLSNDQMVELAVGLERSRVHFIWCFKEGHVDGEEYGLLPSGFEDRVAERGLVIRGWAPQVLILNHRAVGAFLTHCGWNSVLEGLVAGVPMLAWPMGADQFINANLLVDQLKVGVRVCEGADAVPNSTELARLVAESVSGNPVHRERAMELRKVAIEAVKESGTSGKDVDELVNSICRIGVKNGYMRM